MKPNHLATPYHCYLINWGPCGGKVITESADPEAGAEGEEPEEHPVAAADPVELEDLSFDSPGLRHGLHGEFL